MPRFKPPKNYVLGIAIVLAGLATKHFYSPGTALNQLTSTVVLSDVEQTVLASGTLQARDQISVGAQVSGQLKSLKVVLGQNVKKGDLVAEIDSTSQRNSVRNAAAALNLVKAQKRSKQASLRLAELTSERQRQMLDQNAGTRADYETAVATLDITRADVAAIDAQIEQAVISLDTAKVDLGYTRITSPIDGKVVAIVTKEGQTVNAAQQTPTIIKVADLDTLTVKAQIAEADVTRVRVGQQVYFAIPGELDHRYSSRLRAIEPAPDTVNQDLVASSGPNGGSGVTAVYYNGLFDVPNPEGKLRIAMTAQVSIVLAEAKRALTIPSIALGEPEETGEYIVQVAITPQRQEARKVRIGIDNGINAQVLSGLKVGEKVLLSEPSQ